MERRSFLQKAAVTGAGVGASVIAAPAIAQKRKEMVIVSSWPRDFPGLGTSAQRVAKRITDMTGGAITTTYYAAGERVGGFDVFDEVSSGNAQAYISADYYWKGKHPAWAFFTSVPFGMTYAEMGAWIYSQGGQQLWDELADGFGLKCMPVGNTGVQMGGWFRKEIESTDDLKGLKIRMPGLGGDVMAKVGASPISLPGGQIYENLVSGAIDATEWVGPWNDYFMKFYEAAKYYYYPGMHEPGGFTSIGFNKAFWSELTTEEKLILEAACNYEAHLMMAETNANNSIYTGKLVDEHGVELREFNDDIYESLAKAAVEVFEETRQHDAMTEKVYSSFLASRDAVANWMKLSDVGYSIKRNRALGI